MHEPADDSAEATADRIERLMELGLDLEARGAFEEAARA